MSDPMEEMRLHGGDPALFGAAVEALRTMASRPLTANFAVGIAALAHRSAAGRGWALHDPSGPTIDASSMQALCDAVWAKREAFLPPSASGPVYKPFTSNFKGRSPKVNNWRNSFDLQGGIGCDAPWSADFLASHNYLAEQRYYCEFRDPETAQCSSPAGYAAGDRTCFDPSKNGHPPGPDSGSQAKHRPKILARGFDDGGNQGYWLLEPIPEVLAGLLDSPTNRVPLYPFAAAMYCGSDYWAADGGETITGARLASDLGLDDASFYSIFDPSLAHPGNMRLFEYFRDGSANSSFVPQVSGAKAPPGNATSAMSTLGLPSPRDYVDSPLDQIRVRAGAASNPEQRAVLLERATRAHQRTVGKLAAVLGARGYACSEQPGGFDLLAQREGSETCLFEVKSWTEFNLASQVRSGWAQLYEYRFRNADILDDEVPRLYLVFDRQPPRDFWAWAWLVEYMGVLPIWIEDEELLTFPGWESLLPA